jgi:hypothetical protein
MTYRYTETKRLLFLGLPDAEKVLRNAGHYSGRPIMVNGERLKVLAASCLGVYFHRVPKMVLWVTLEREVKHDQP